MNHDTGSTIWKLELGPMSTFSLFCIGIDFVLEEIRFLAGSVSIHSVWLCWKRLQSTALRVTEILSLSAEKERETNMQT